METSGAAERVGEGQEGESGGTIVMIATRYVCNVETDLVAVSFLYSNAQLCNTVQ